MNKQVAILMSSQNDSVQFNPKLGAIEWRGQVCPYVEINSVLGEEISSLETAKEEVKQCLALLELLLAHQQSSHLLLDALATQFVNKFKECVDTHFTVGFNFQQKLIESGSKHSKTNELLEKHSLLVSMKGKEPMALRLALKPMAENEAMLSFYCFKQGTPLFSVKGISRLRKMLKFVGGELEGFLNSKYQRLKKEYLNADIHTLYNLAYQNRS